jgi:hypothetical protein
MLRQAMSEREGEATLFFQSAKPQEVSLIAQRGEDFRTRMRTTDDRLRLFADAEITDRMLLKGYGYAPGFLLTLVSL